ncbi:MAG TPA: BTAD domain-containing putative transcriptional regulator [Rubrobacter sp.]|nr:BTAD domain-containing putative transcriptional regulator [Rubrobacter sp.]
MRKAENLVKRLALARDRRLHRDQVSDLLWPDLETKSAANNLHRALHFARRVLEPAPGTTASRYLVFQGELLALCPDGPLWVDVKSFESAAASARRSREIAAYRVAIDLYAGDLLPGDRYERWVEDRRQELRMVYLALLVELAALYEEQEEPGPAIEALQEVVANERTYEEAHSSLMRLYTMNGRRQEALLQYQRLQKALAEDLGAEPDATSRCLHEEILIGRFPLTRFSHAGRPPEKPQDATKKHNLPNLRSSFVGRERDLMEVKRVLAMTGLLTLTGTGGCGKTRLALEAAKDLVGVHPDGVWLVELASLSNPALVPQVVASALGVREQPGRSMTETLSTHLESRQLLLVLDNCEHLVHTCARLVDALLGSCEHLRILATSREALGVAGEANWPVLPLAVPDAERPAPVDDLVRCEAVRLFLDRARSKQPAFSLEPRNAPAVARVCRKLDGIPLAIELAAARVTTLAVDQIAARFEDSLDLLTSGNRMADHRHRTLRTTVEWSHRLLSQKERKLFGRLSAFSGGWTLEAAETVGAGNGLEEGDVLDLLSRLVEKSLVVAEASPGDDGVLRYRMLEPVRQYGRERLEESGEEEQVRDRHARYYLALTEAAKTELLDGPRPLAYLEQLKAEHGNLRGALGWCLEEAAGSKERAEMGLKLAAALGRFWNTYGPGEGRRWLERGLARSGASPTSLRARALGEAGFIAIFQGDPRAIALLEEGLTLSRELEDESGLAFSISNLGHAVAHSGDHDRLAMLREEADALLREPLDQRARAHLLLFLGVAAMSEGDREQVAARTGEALAMFRELGDIRHVAMSLGVAGVSALEQGDSERAAVLFEEDLRLLRELRDKAGIVYGLLGMAGVAALRGQYTRASKLWGASEVLREVFGLPLTPMVRDRYDYEGYLAAACAGLEEAAFEAAWSEGRAMSPQQAIEYALGPEDPPPPPSEKKASSEGSLEALTRRQLEVAILVARGLTNRQAAAELVLSEHTVATHVREILKRLGLRSRTELASWIAERGPIN